MFIKLFNIIDRYYHTGSFCFIARAKSSQNKLRILYNHTQIYTKGICNYYSSGSTETINHLLCSQMSNQDEQSNLKSLYTRNILNLYYCPSLISVSYF